MVTPEYKLRYENKAGLDGTAKIVRVNLTLPRAEFLEFRKICLKQRIPISHAIAELIEAALAED